MATPLLVQSQQQRMQMVLAPQLRQSLEFLQVPLLELRSLIQQEMEQNPTLEERITENEHIEVETPALEPKDEAIKDFGEEYEVLAQIDDDWNDYFRDYAAPSVSSQDAEEKRKYFLDSITQPESLQEHLRHQLALSGFSEEEQQAGEFLVGHIDEDGYLSVSLPELSLTSGYTETLLSSVMRVIRDFDPVGVGSRNLQDCLLYQIEREGKKGTSTEYVVRDYLAELAAHKYTVIARKLKISVEQVHAIALHVATLDPKPGRRFSSETASYVTPEVYVQKVNGCYVVSLNEDQLPRVRISKHYRALMESPETPPDVKKYILEKMKSGTFLMKSIRQRQKTIRDIATEVVRVQERFMEEGVQHLHPLTMVRVADVVGVHETTVSRAVAGKYMQTPQGIYEMKYFFTTGYQTASGESLSNKSVQGRIQQLVGDESPSAPLSDQAIATQLKKEGINVARRTVAKYREELKILPSHLRRSA